MTMARRKQSTTNLAAINRDRVYDLSKLDTPYQSQLRSILALSDAELNRVARAMHLDLQCTLSNKLRSSPQKVVPQYFADIAGKHSLNPPRSAYHNWRAMQKWYVGTLRT
tara:strand:+ start:65 stop:394 length:330 start_codon:yes stop_codon:yes gene_type:complete